MLLVQNKVESIGSLLTLREAAREKQVNYEALKKWVYRSQVPVKRLGRSILLDRKDLNKYHPMKFIQQ